MPPESTRTVLFAANDTPPAAEPACALSHAAVPAGACDPVPVLVSKVYEEAPPAVRGRLLEHLLQPLGVLSLVAVANGVFARFALDQRWSHIKVNAEDAMRVHGSDVLALVQRVQQVSAGAIDGLAQVLAATPMHSSSAATALLLTILAQRALTRAPDDDFDPQPVPAAPTGAA